MRNLHIVGRHYFYYRFAKLSNFFSKNIFGKNIEVDYNDKKMKYLSQFNFRFELVCSFFSVKLEIINKLQCETVTQITHHAVYYDD